MASPPARRRPGSPRNSQSSSAAAAAAAAAPAAPKATAKTTVPSKRADSATSLPRILWKRRVPLLIAHASLGGFAEPAGQSSAEADPLSSSSPSSHPSPSRPSSPHSPPLASSSHPSPPPSSSSSSPLIFAASVPRFGYLAQLLPRLSAFFGRPCSSFQHEDVPLRNLPLGLLMDLYLPPPPAAGVAAEAGSSRDRRLPWRLVVADGEAWHLGDTFLNGAKEADYVRYGSAKQIMGLSKENTEALWEAVQDNDYATFSRVNNLLLNAPVPLKHIPLRIYIPSSAPSKPSSASSAPPAAAATPPNIPGSYKIIQPLVAPRATNRQPQTLGAVLRSLLPLLFPSSRDPVLANVILHGAPVPFCTPLEELMREAAYPDGWLSLVVVLL